MDFYLYILEKILQHCFTCWVASAHTVGNWLGLSSVLKLNLVQTRWNDGKLFRRLGGLIAILIYVFLNRDETKLYICNFNRCSLRSYIIS